MVEVMSFCCDTCGGGLEHVSGNSYACPYCGGKKFVNTCTDAEKGLILLADGARRAMRFDEAVEHYEAVLKTSPQNFNALWGLFLSEYGIEYVKDVDDSYKPTFHRLSRVSVFLNRHMQDALDLLKGGEKTKYESDAAAIEQIRVKTLQAADRNEPYDIFICYKKTKPDGNGLTPEAAWAQDYYTELRSLGYKVFWADKSIKPGDEYEPSVYNALFTAKFMIILCSDPGHLDATWVMNEWGRYLRRRKDDPSIGFCVVHQNVEPYSLPRALRQAQAIDHTRATSFGLLKEVIETAVRGGAPAAVQTAQKPQKIQKQEKPYNKKYFKIRLALLFAIPLAMLIIGFALWHRFPVSTAGMAIYTVLSAVWVGLCIYDGKRLFAPGVRKKIFAGTMASILALCLLLSAGIYFWTEYGYYDGFEAGFYYRNSYYDETDSTVKTDGVEICSYRGNAAEVVIPSQINGKPVRAIDSSTCFYDSPVTAVTIPSTVLRVGLSGKFITTVTLSEGTVSIENSAFGGCPALESITIPSSVTSIGRDAFRDTELWQNTAENSVVYADKWAVGIKQEDKERFLGVLPLKADTVGIADNAFEWRTGITSVTIPSDVKIIGQTAFNGCSGLTSTTFASGSQLKSIESGVFGYCSALTNITLPSGVTSIGNNAFDSCNALTGITIPSSVKSIGDQAFQYCYGLTNMTIPSGTTTIGNSAFAYCGNISDILIPSSITTVKYYAFRDWRAEQTIRIQGQSSRPSGWDNDWNANCNAQVVWNV